MPEHDELEGGLARVLRSNKPQPPLGSSAGGGLLLTKRVGEKSCPEVE